jgi:hypothetical protein
MFYVTAKNQKKEILSIECDTQDEALIVMGNLARNPYKYKYVTLRDSSPYKRGCKIERYNKQTIPTLYRKYRKENGK